MKVIDQYASEIQGKKALVRCNFDVPLKDGLVVDTTRIEDALPTLIFLLSRHCQLTLIAHQGRPEGQFSPDASLSPIALALKKLLQRPVTFIPYEKMTTFIPGPDNLYLLDNLRFFPQEEAKDLAFAQNLAKGQDFYVDESFATAHRDHTSITLIPQVIPSYLGISFAKEIQVLDQILTAPQKPLVLVLGGAKIETKEPLIEVFKTLADQILVGGKIALDLKDRTNLPKNVIVAGLTQNTKDITSESAEHFARIIASAGTVIWNGTMGVFEEPPNDAGTRLIAQAVNHTQAFTLVGGGDTETATTLFNAQDHLSHLSSGGGAMLTYLSTGSLPGLQAIK